MNLINRLLFVVFATVAAFFAAVCVERLAALSSLVPSLMLPLFLVAVALSVCAGLMKSWKPFFLAVCMFLVVSFGTRIANQGTRQAEFEKVSRFPQLQVSHARRTL